MALSRLFFALWPNSEISNSIKSNVEQVRESIRGKYVPDSNWHVTLAFLGNVDDDTKACLIERAGLIQFKPFSIGFTKVQYFNNSKIVSIGGGDNSELDSLVQKCRLVQDECGLKSESRKFVPHITVARKADRPEREIVIEPVAWEVDEFVLVMSEVSERGSVYTVLRRWEI